MEKKYNIGSLEGQTFEFLNSDSSENNIPVYYSLNLDLKIEYIEIKENDKLNNLLGRIPMNENETIVFNDTGEKKVKDLADDEIVISDIMFNKLTDYKYISGYTGTFNEPYYSENGKSNATKYLINYLKNNNVIGSKIKLNIKDGALSSDNYEEFKIVGIMMSEPISDYGMNGMLLQKNDINPNEITVFCSKNVARLFITNNAQLFKMVTKISNKDNLKKILELYPAIDSNIISYSNYSNKVINTYIEAKGLGEILKYVIIVFAVFSAFVVVDFIQKSVKSSRKKIGTLRALGCRSIDVMKIFLSESCLMMILPLIISIVVSPMLIEKINQFMINQGILEINMLSFGIINIIEIIVFMIMIILVSNVLLVGKATRMKPIDAILNK